MEDCPSALPATDAPRAITETAVRIRIGWVGGSPKDMCPGSRRLSPRSEMITLERIYFRYRRAVSLKTAAIFGSLAIGAVACTYMRPIEPQTNAVLPHVDRQSVTDVGHAAVIGTISDSVSGRPLHGAVAILFVRYDSAKIEAYTDSSGGFVLRLVQPGRYKLALRAVGYAQQVSEHILMAGAIDTVIGRLRIDPFRLLSASSHRVVALQSTQAGLITGSFAPHSPTLAK